MNTMVIEHPILTDKMNVIKVRREQEIADKEMAIVRLECAETTWGELANAVSAQIVAEKKELAELIATL